MKIFMRLSLTLISNHIAIDNRITIDNTHHMERSSGVVNHADNAHDDNTQVSDTLPSDNISYLTNDDATYESPKKNNILENDDDETSTFVADSYSNHATYDHDNSKSESTIMYLHMMMISQHLKQIPNKMLP